MWTTHKIGRSRRLIYDMVNEYISKVLDSFHMEEERAQYGEYRINVKDFDPSG